MKFFGVAKFDRYKAKPSIKKVGIDRVDCNPKELIKRREHLLMYIACLHYIMQTADGIRSVISVIITNFDWVCDVQIT